MVAIDTDPIKEFLIKQVVMPRTMLLDVPGYILAKSPGAFARYIYLSEPFFVLLESKVADRLGEEGLKKLYGAGKRFGYRFCTLMGLSKTDIRFNAKMAFEFSAMFYADSIETKVDLANKVVVADTKDVVVTRVNGSGLSLMVGGAAGLWGYFLNDYDKIECGVIAKGGNRYIFVCGPPEKLIERGITFYEAHGAPDVNDRTIYILFNQPPGHIPSSAFNVTKLMHTPPFYYYDNNPWKHALPNVRLVDVEIAYPYELELTVGSQIVYEAAKESFKLIGQNVPKQLDSHFFLTNMLTALGYGIVTAERSSDSESFYFSGAPWYVAADKSTFPVIRGAIEGFLEGQGIMAKASYARSEIYNTTFRVSIDVSL